MRFLVAALAALFLVPTAQATTVLFTTNSQYVSQAQLEAAVPAFQIAVSRDLAPAWGTDAVLTTDPSVKADMTVKVTDDVPCFNCLGFHDAKGQPYSVIGGALCGFYGDDWRLVATHELFEMLVDPWINHFASWRKRQYLVEVADPVESGAFAYWIGDVPISDFVTPFWYGVARGKPVDFTHGLNAPGQIGRHGYASWLTPDGWQQAFG